MRYLPDLPVAIGRTAAMRYRMGPRSIRGGLVRKLGGLSDILLAHHDDVGDAAWLRETDRAGEDGGPYLRGQRCLIHRDARAWNLESDDAAPPIYRESPCSG